DVQRAAEEALTQTMKDIQSGRLGTAYPNAKVGAAVAMDVHTGEVICMASLPNYDPNLFATGTISKADWDALSPRYTVDGTLFQDTDPTLERPLVNNAVSTAFPPGSTFKMAVALAGLTEGAIDKDEQIEDKGRYTKYSETNAPTCWLYSGTGATHGKVNIVDALAVSCNYFFYALGDRLGADAIEKYARRLGLGEKTGIDLPGEAAGSVDSATYYTQSLEKKIYKLLKGALSGMDETTLQNTAKEMSKDTDLTQVIAQLKALNVSDTDLQYALNDLIQGYRYRPANVLSSAIGQGGHTTTLIQMATYTAQIANGGTRVVPRLFAGTRNNTPAAPATATKGTLGVSQSVLDTIRSGMEKAVSSGTASSAFKGCTISAAGKTGSAQMSGKDACAWFVGYAPADNPQIAVAVLIAQGGQGTYAAPVGRAILEACFKEGTGTALTSGSGITP
ncbi:MAG: penicillin-binding transpeptidase domain-containing protein, partial [Bacillota bacterium]